MNAKKESSYRSFAAMCSLSFLRYLLLKYLILNTPAFLPRRASTFLTVRLQSAEGIYLSGGSEPAVETVRILFYPPFAEAAVFPH